jgi:hypothetical protein
MIDDCLSLEKQSYCKEYGGSCPNTCLNLSAVSKEPPSEWWSFRRSNHLSYAHLMASRFSTEALRRSLSHVHLSELRRNETAVLNAPLAVHSSTWWCPVAVLQKNRNASIFRQAESFCAHRVSFIFYPCFRGLSYPCA